MVWHTSVAQVVVSGVPAAWPAGPAGPGYLFGWLACWLQHSRVPNRASPHSRAGAWHSRIGANQQHHGAGEDCSDSAVRLLWFELYSSGKLRAFLA